jgi:hypothetical protein
MKSLRLLFVLLAVIAGLPYAVASTIRVPKDQPTIQAGINAANNGDTCWWLPVPTRRTSISMARR